LHLDHVAVVHGSDHQLGGGLRDTCGAGAKAEGQGEGGLEGQVRVSCRMFGWREAIVPSFAAGIDK
jgi:hypothetical protein